ncbi:hypothetical protein ACGRHY_29050 [Streptomyces sp. HK10]|uniref:hypothetical protein n=1 Tax=Streptomyces sp. HK10 TaxID=3373255 RepID=UPI003749B165
MPSYCVCVEFDNANASPDTYADLFDALQDVHGAVGPAPNGNLSARLTIEADSVLQAATLGIERTQSAITGQQGSPSNVTGVEVITEAERDRRLAEGEQEEESQPPSVSTRGPVRPYCVYVEFDNANASPDTYADLFDALQDVHGAVGPAPSGNLSARLTIESSGLKEACAVGLNALKEATQHCSLHIEPALITVRTEERK